MREPIYNYDHSPLVGGERFGRPRVLKPKIFNAASSSNLYMSAFHEMTDRRYAPVNDVGRSVVGTAFFEWLIMLEVKYRLYTNDTYVRRQIAQGVPAAKAFCKVRNVYPHRLLSGNNITGDGKALMKIIPILDEHPEFITDNWTIFSFTISRLKSDNMYPFYVGCKDAHMAAKIKMFL